MSEPRKIIDSAIEELETIQTLIGKVQVCLLQILIDEQIDQWDQIAQTALIKLENVQRDIGGIQVGMLERMMIAQAKASASTMDLKAWLEQRGIEVMPAQAASGLDAAANQLALFLGDQFATLKPFYDYAKRRAQGQGSKWFPLRGLNKPTIATICHFCTMLRNSSFLSEYKHIRDKHSIIFDPIENGQITNFFTGGWLERYVSQLVKRLAREQINRHSEEQVLLGTNVRLPDGTRAEFDVLAGLDTGKVLWIECKTGAWQDYVTRFQLLNKRFLQLPSNQVALILLDELKEEEKASASALTDMQVIHLSELEDWIMKALEPA